MTGSFGENPVSPERVWFDRRRQPQLRRRALRSHQVAVVKGAVRADEFELGQDSTDAIAVARERQQQSLVMHQSVFAVDGVVDSIDGAAAVRRPPIGRQLLRAFRLQQGFIEKFAATVRRSKDLGNERAVKADLKT